MTFKNLVTVVALCLFSSSMVAAQSAHADDSRTAGEMAKCAVGLGFKAEMTLGYAVEELYQLVFADHWRKGPNKAYENAMAEADDQFCPNNTQSSAPVVAEEAATSKPVRRAVEHVDEQFRHANTIVITPAK